MRSIRLNLTHKKKFSIVITPVGMDIEETLASRFQAYRGTAPPMPSPVRGAKDESSPKGDRTAEGGTSTKSSSGNALVHLKEHKYVIVFGLVVAAYLVYKQQKDGTFSFYMGTPKVSSVPSSSETQQNTDNEDPLFTPIGEL